ncbi:B-cell lymphoma 6 protein [Parasponia andersonii]|uniref:B-cell lymphoma 6 protein n=1 Tax=Parasponia andersonii TaxID=3476 RepID=A0A2P5DQV5_PARAD|nr:B-cell lymphoma 6 protein [Parasponia andersonii]
MARSLVLLVFLFALIISYMPSYEARKVMSPQKKDFLLLQDSSAHQAMLPKDQYSSGIEEGQAVAENEKFSAVITFGESNRVLRSVPSPGIGN